MLRSRIDHIAIAVPTLAVGVEYIWQNLGVTPQPGGEHPRMGTHNCVLKLGHRVYLEIIAINPCAPAPDRPRWFQLDETNSNQVPRLITWVVRTNDIPSAAAAAPISWGSIEPMVRGEFNWQITIPADGRLPLDGVAPTLIQWQGPHPADTMQDSRCSLVGLSGFHPEPGKVRAALAAIGFEGDFSISALPSDRRSYLVAHIRTPKGLRELCIADRRPHQSQ